MFMTRAIYVDELEFSFEAVTFLCALCQFMYFLNGCSLNNRTDSSISCSRHINKFACVNHSQVPGSYETMTHMTWLFSDSSLDPEQTPHSRRSTLAIQWAIRKCLCVWTKRHLAVDNQTVVSTRAIRPGEWLFFNHMPISRLRNPVFREKQRQRTVWTLKHMMKEVCFLRTSQFPWSSALLVRTAFYEITRDPSYKSFFSLAIS